MGKSIFEPIGRFPLRPRRSRVYTLRVLGITCKGTLREWIEDILGSTALFVLFSLICYFLLWLNEPIR